MKLSDLRSIIRSTKGNPAVQVTLAGKRMTLPLQKTPLLAALGDAFDNQRTVETGMAFDEDTGLLYSEGGADEIADEADSSDQASLDVEFDLDDNDFDI